jgi:biopolymer transport protein ExbD
MRQRRVIDEPEGSPQINIVPMIDVIFAILAFFIMSTLFLTRQEGLLVNLPTAQTATPQKSSRATVTIDRQGQLFLNREAIALEQLEMALTKQRPPGQDLTVVLNADGAVTHDRVIAVMDELRKIPGTRVAMSTRRP